MTCVQDLRHRDTVSSRALDSFHVVTTEKEALKKSIKGAPNVIKEPQKQLPRVREEPKALREMQVPRLKEGKPRRLPSPPHNSTVDPELLQQAHANPGSSTYQARGTSKLSNAWVRVENDSSLLKAEDLTTKEETGGKVVGPQIPPPMDGWICVERPPIPPPMTWEDAFKVAQKAREAVVDAKLKTGPSPLTCLPEPLRSDTNPPTSHSSRATNSSSEILPGQGAVFSPLLPKQSPSRISNGCVKARINAFESSMLQGPDPSTSKLENEKVTSGTTPPEMEVVARDKQKEAPEKLKKWQDRERNKEPSSRGTANREECRNTQGDPTEKGSSRQDLPRDSNAKDREQSLREGCQSSSRLDKPAAAGRSDLRSVGNLATQGESRQTGRAYRLPELQDINVKALENQSTQHSVTKEEFVSALDGRLPQTAKEEGGNVLDQAYWRLVSHIQENTSMEELGPGSKEEGKAVAARRPISVDSKPDKTGDVPFSGSKGTRPEKHSEPHQCNKVRRPRNSLAGPKQAPSDKQKPSRPGGSLQAWKDLQKSLEERARKSFVMKCALNESLEKTAACSDRVTSKSIDDSFATAARQVHFFVKEKSDTVMEGQQSPPAGPASCEGTSHKTGRDVTSTNHSNLLSHLGGGVKQVLGGAVILAGLFALWPRNGGPVDRYHVVKAGETLSSIAPGHCTDPSSNFCRINPRLEFQAVFSSDIQQVSVAIESLANTDYSSPSFCHSERRFTEPLSKVTR